MTYSFPLRFIHLDDHRLFRNGLANACILPFYKSPEIFEFFDGDEAFDFIKNEILHQNRIDLFVTDINHPGMKGNELVKAIRIYEGLFTNSNRIPIVIISMVEESNYLELKVNNFVTAYFTKTTKTDEIIACFKKILFSESSQQVV